MTRCGTLKTIIPRKLLCPVESRQGGEIEDGVDEHREDEWREAI